MAMKILGISFLVSRALIFEAVKNDQVTIVRHSRMPIPLIITGSAGPGVETRKIKCFCTLIGARI